VTTGPSSASASDSAHPHALGFVVATERRPSTPHAFHFRTSVDAAVGIGTIVRAEGRESARGVVTLVFGVVVEGIGYTDPEPEETRLYTVHVLRHVPEEPLQPVAIGPVFLASQRDIATALRMDGFSDGASSTAIPIGVYRSGDLDAPIFLDADFLVGPEAAHLNISGVSGLATKTSAIEWVLQSMFAHFPKAKGSIAVVCFNVKGPDLCFLDQPGEIGPDDRAIYEAVGVPATPFAHVEYFAPYTARGLQVNTYRTHPSLVDSVTPLTWGLGEVLEYADVLLDKDDLDAKADALVDFIRERVVGKKFEEKGFTRAHVVQSFADLDAWFRDVLRKLEGGSGDTWRTHHAATIRKVRNRLSNLSTRCAGLVTDDGVVSDLPFGSFVDRTVYVVDVARVEEDAQDLVFARVVSQLREHLEQRALGVDHVVVFVDELNKYAPAEGPDTYVRKMLLDISERGRYLGLVLFGAEQFRSQVHRRVVGNAGTTLYGRMDADELATPGYYVLSAGIKARLATLEKGQLMVRHPHFAQPVFVRFPRPAVLAGRDGVERFPPAPEPSLAVAVGRELRRLDAAIDLGWVQQAILLHEEVDVLAARNAVSRMRPADVKAAFVRELNRRTRPAAHVVEQAAPRARAIRNFAPDEYGG
jgi:DNA helicase HerA-like ATPase